MTIKEQVIFAKAEGKSYTEIYREFGVSKSTAWDWVNADKDKVIGYVNDNLNRDRVKRFQKSEVDIMDFLSQLAPINVSGGNKSPKMVLNQYAVVGV